jgi:hypothetical protein
MLKWMQYVRHLKNHFFPQTHPDDHRIPRRTNAGEKLFSSVSPGAKKFWFFKNLNGYKRGDMNVLDEIKNFASTIQAEMKEKKGVYELSLVIAERKGFLSKKKLSYSARFRIDEGNREVKFFEMLKESGSGISGGGGFDDGGSPGFGFKKEVYQSGGGGREGTIEEQSRLFGQDYSYGFEYQEIRKRIEALAQSAGHTFQYQITSVGL